MVDPDTRVAHEIMERAIWRLSVLEYLILGAAVVFALAGGALVAWLLIQLFGLSFRLTWAASSILLFVVPALGVYGPQIVRRRGATHGKQNTSET